MKEKLVDKEKLTPSLICRIHEFLCRGCYDESRWAKGERPGEFKKNYYGVGLPVGVPPENVEEEISYICKEIEGAKLRSTLDVLKPAVRFHCNFERIHAFADGNVRVRRSLLKYMNILSGVYDTNTNQVFFDHL